MINQISHEAPSVASKLYPIGVGTLFLAGVVLTTLAAMNFLGPLNGVGTITALSIGALNIAVCCIPIGFAIYQVTSERPPKISFSATQEQIQKVKWHCSSRSIREQLAPFYLNTHELACEKWREYTHQPGEKLVLVVPVGEINDRLEYEEASKPFEFLTRFQDSLGDQLLVVFMVQDRVSVPSIEERVRNVSNRAVVWKNVFDSQRWISTKNPNWQQELNTFICS